MSPTDTTPLLYSWDDQSRHQDPDWHKLRNYHGAWYRRISRRRFSQFIFAFGLMTLFVLVYSISSNLHTPTQFTGHKVRGRRGAVASEVPVCSDIGVSMLADGGNAVDAAIASTFCIGVVNFFSSGIGGGGFMLIKHPNETAQSLTFREIAPGNVSKHMFDKNPMLAQVGPLSIAIPGELAGLYEAWKSHGLLDWSKLLEPNVKLAREGFPVTRAMERVLKLPEMAHLLKDPIWQPILMPNGKVLRAGDKMFRPAYAKTLEIIANKGIEPFYRGELTNSMVKFIQDNGGIVTVEDFGNYSTVFADALHTSYRGHDVYTCTLPTSGPALIEGLNILDGYPLNTPSLAFPKRLHLEVEAMKWLSAGRTQFGDPDFLPLDHLDVVSKLLSKEFASQIRNNISLSKTYPWEHYNPSYDLPISHGTTHVSTVDSNNLAVSITSTVNLLFGSQLMDPVTGVVFNDQMDDFSIPGASNAFNLSPSPWNFIEPFKRPQSSSAPTILTDINGDFEMALGASGGSRIVTAVLDSIIKRIDMDYDIESMVASARPHHQLLPDILILESGFSKSVATRMKKYGHKVWRLKQHDTPLSQIQAVTRHHSEYYGMSDPRKYGQAAAY
ncbi:gamma-glutamyltranspeptidase Ggt2 [Schizosaccharomyces pombe]|uniref:Glutathione hydrolase proenzyme 2 n=1 Tax=Schizosaccharomyces pombe (strain 972 / ATCC 24843) TaxID=284812 RepID=GGT2_SCHPO|nr:gamma-glutamyltranspeptidase Ggt2 [Schizosaccharomyces pombe]O14194.1 RecName: Full=Glutathione hydrolase proenzyme 2; AltName: Full=Gamma-glutamyltransferase 2; AltName: Full=Gamma-glutamyltranspeptidase 2; Contains: RecName: Full=Glutathione hydrolase 2 heavy chain; Contains: RecName: Full=Glutathione hydrolase 2 light chain; Flags: Precursor [Schizosaccharomyces pombe 972h-]AAQ57121.1 gamma glutamyl-transpeptidase [Schizosaccharomyces pombe]CAB16397.1 gamma-glutamyltranspeptidase Ggt2 [Sch|eukprot:NP_593273.1 gamma-glutamyltranspeptidase Ggt2 [Schizosaccharomyces pombe]